MTSKDVARLIEAERAVTGTLLARMKDTDAAKAVVDLKAAVQHALATLQAHGEAEYARGLEDAAQIVIDHQQRYLEQRSTSDSAALLPVKKDILALKPKEDGRG